MIFTSFPAIPSLGFIMNSSFVVSGKQVETFRLNSMLPFVFSIFCLLAVWQSSFCSVVPQAVSINSFKSSPSTISGTTVHSIASQWGYILTPLSPNPTSCIWIFFLLVASKQR